MATDTATDSPADTARDNRSVRSAIYTVLRLAVDLFVATCWVLLLTLLFLENAWPRWLFYVLLIGGIGLYVAVTAAWRD
ncbi:hypothetical protein [Natronolimnohabitans innermongolicus]|uniref:DUF8119 domain-containing protein n=1 Tax=Natronolimnohabitans innermongolicus JCM 12255 TaxID=1227499 RepID=L9XGE6_9EURY|nr:hypothetical protein [Natronolimnohabitans innermongolicus]ELY60677.1 hypothetical protein C493_04351 [Natronolimnohabitans innermongolicus JCM 12255]